MFHRLCHSEADFITCVILLMQWLEPPKQALMETLNQQRMRWCIYKESGVFSYYYPCSRGAVYNERSAIVHDLWTIIVLYFYNSVAFVCVITVAFPRLKALRSSTLSSVRLMTLVARLLPVPAVLPSNPWPLWTRRVVCDKPRPQFQQQQTTRALDTSRHCGTAQFRHLDHTDWPIRPPTVLYVYWLHACGYSMLLIMLLLLLIAKWPFIRPLTDLRIRLDNAEIRRRFLKSSCTVFPQHFFY